MTYTNRFLLVALLTILPGCGDDAPSTPTDAGPLGQCVSMSDMDLLSTPVGDAGIPDPTLIGGLCATVDCLDELLNQGQAAADACMDACWASSDLGGLTDGCRDCYLEAVYCAGMECAVPCVAGGPDCVPCIEENCDPRTAECTGL